MKILTYPLSRVNLADLDKQLRTALPGKFEGLGADVDRLGNVLAEKEAKQILIYVADDLTPTEQELIGSVIDDHVPTEPVEAKDPVTLKLEELEARIQALEGK